MKKTEKTQAVENPTEAPTEVSYAEIDGGLWDKEIELQKVYGMSPKEAYAYSCVEIHGMTQTSTAEAMGCAPGTVKSLLTRAKNKVNTEQVKTKTFVVPELPKTDRAKGYKVPVIKKVGYFLEQVCGTTFMEGKHSSIIVFPAEQVGDLAWYKANIATKVSVVGSGFDSDTKCKQVATKMVDIVYATGEINKIGWSVLKYHLDQMLVPYDVYENQPHTEGR